MNEQLLQELLKRLDKVGALAAEGGKEAFHQLVRVQRFDAIVGMSTWVLVGLATSAVAYKMAKRNQKRANDPDLPKWARGPCQADYRALATGSHIVCAFGVFIIILAVALNLRSIIMPEATLIQSLIGRS